MPMLLLQLQCHYRRRHCRRRWCGYGHRDDDYINIIEQQLALHNHHVVCQCFIISTIYNYNILLEAVAEAVFFFYYFLFSHWKIIIPRRQH
jgi:hypothetical protein